MNTKIIDKYRQLTLKTGWLTDSELEWYNRATKAIYGRFGRFPNEPTKYLQNKLLASLPG